MSTFADSSALVKLYADEPDSDSIRSVPALIIAELARVEVPAAIWRKCRIGELDSADAAVLVAAFEADYFGTYREPARFATVATSPDVLETAARMVGVHGLRAYDAVQLASARMAARADSTCHTLAATDKRLREAAAAEGFALLPDGG